MSTDSGNDPFRNPLERKTPLGGPAGVAIASVAPFAALILFLVFGFLGFWSWSWIFWLLVPIAFIAVYGLRSNGPSS